MKEIVRKQIIREICEDCVDALISGIEECTEDFNYTISVINFISELRLKGINADVNNILIDTFLDEINKEVFKYLAK